MFTALSFPIDLSLFDHKANIVRTTVKVNARIAKVFEFAKLHIY